MAAEDTDEVGVMPEDAPFILSLDVIAGRVRGTMNVGGCYADYLC